MLIFSHSYLNQFPLFRLLLIMSQGVKTQDTQLSYRNFTSIPHSHAALPLVIHTFFSLPLSPFLPHTNHLCTKVPSASDPTRSFHQLLKKRQWVRTEFPRNLISVPSRKKRPKKPKKPKRTCARKRRDSKHACCSVENTISKEGLL